MLVETIQKVQDRLNPELEIDGLVATMYDSRTVHSREVLARLVEAFGDKVFHTVIARTVRFPETTVAGEPITTFASARAAPTPTASWPGRCLSGARARERRDGAGEPTATAPTAGAAGAGAPAPAAQRAGRPAASGTTRRSPSTSRPEELFALEQARLVLRAEHGLADRPRAAGA